MADIFKVHEERSKGKVMKKVVDVPFRLFLNNKDILSKTQNHSLFLRMLLSLQTNNWYTILVANFLHNPHI
jgi:hypothetical protein